MVRRIYPRQSLKQEVLGVDRKICPAMLQQTNCQQDAQCSDSAPRRIRGSVAMWGTAGFQEDPLMMSRCSTWQNAFLKEPSENAKNLWGTPIPNEELEGESAPLLMGPIAM